MTARKPSVEARKRRKFFEAGTCRLCHSPMVMHATRLCRSCRPGEQERVELEAGIALEDEKATAYLRYFLTVRKKEESDIGKFARFYLRDRAFKGIAGLDAIRGVAIASSFSETIVEQAWQASEAQRSAAQD